MFFDEEVDEEEGNAQPAFEPQAAAPKPVAAMPVRKLVRLPTSQPVLGPPVEPAAYEPTPEPCKTSDWVVVGVKSDYKGRATARSRDLSLTDQPQ